MYQHPGALQVIVLGRESVLHIYWFPREEEELPVLFSLISTHLKRSVTRLLLCSLVVHTKVQKPLNSQHWESAVLM